MGCALEETPLGIQVRTDAENKTSVAGIFACGDVARTPHSVSLAVGNGAMAGAQIHRSLLWPETLAST
jgi:thioredoxin reductase